MNFHSRKGTFCSRPLIYDPTVHDPCGGHRWPAGRLTAPARWCAMGAATRLVGVLGSLAPVHQNSSRDREQRRKKRTHQGDACGPRANDERAPRRRTWSATPRSKSLRFRAARAWFRVLDAKTRRGASRGTLYGVDWWKRQENCGFDLLPGVLLGHEQGRRRRRSVGPTRQREKEGAPAVGHRTEEGGGRRACGLAGWAALRAKRKKGRGGNAGLRGEREAGPAWIQGGCPLFLLFFFSILFFSKGFLSKE